MNNQSNKTLSKKQLISALPFIIGMIISNYYSNKAILMTYFCIYYLGLVIFWGREIISKCKHTVSLIREIRQRRYFLCYRYWLWIWCCKKTRSRNKYHYFCLRIFLCCSIVNIHIFSSWYSFKFEILFRCNSSLLSINCDFLSYEILSDKLLLLFTTYNNFKCKWKFVFMGKDWKY